MTPVISWRNSLFNTTKLKTVTHRISNIYIDEHSVVSVVIESGITVNTVKFSMEYAQEIGFINLDALKNYCK